MYLKKIYIPNLVSVFLLAGLLTSCHTGHDKKMTEKHLPHDSSGGAAYKMLFVIDPSIPEAGKQTQISLRPINTSTDSTVELDIQHEKKIHFIVVPEDLSSFKHLHPIEQADGSFKLTDTFSHGGNYILYADYKPVGVEKIVEQQIIKVEGKNEKPAVFESQVLQNTTNGYSVLLKPGTPAITSGKETMLMAEISESGSAVSPVNLENYLGEKAHMVIIGVTNKKYLHVHPMVSGNELMLHTSFPEAGIYRAWLEFKKDGKINVADFTIKVN